MRRFVRHPADIPIQITLTPVDDGESDCAMLDVSQGGVACKCTHHIDVGSQVEVYIPSVWPEYHGKGEVVWCREEGETYEIGISFTNVQEAFKSRMVQQVCQIEHYKNVVFEREGRILDGDQAAAEWIEKHAAEFSR